MQSTNRANPVRYSVHYTALALLAGAGEADYGSRLIITTDFLTGIALTSGRLLRYKLRPRLWLRSISSFLYTEVTALTSTTRIKIKNAKHMDCSENV